MQEGHVGRPQRQGDSGQPLMPRRADGIEPLPRPLHRARLAVQHPGQTAGAKGLHRQFGRQRPRGRATGREIPRRNPAQEIHMHDLAAIH